MMNELLKEAIKDVCYIGVTTAVGIVGYYFKRFVNSKQQLMEKQKEELINKIGISQYNRDIKVAKNIVMSVEEMGREFNWEGAIKHSKAVESISEKTSLSGGDIYDIIKGSVAELNVNKEKQKIEQ